MTHEQLGIYTTFKNQMSSRERVLATIQGKPVDLGGYYLPDDKKATAIMRPSETFNKIIDEM